ncbi:MAG: hypothetical protein RL328_3 [Acidobacteriota bacterium]
MSSTRIVQIIHPEYGRRVALVNEGELHLLSAHRTAYQFAMAAIEIGAPLRDLLSTDLSGIVLDYDEVHALRSNWRFLPSFDHPTELSKCFVSGVGNAHNGTKDGRPVAPSWFYKGNGAHLRAHGESLPIPPYAIGGAEEIEVAGVWVISPQGRPVLVGLTPGNEFCDPATEAADPRMRSHGKLRACSIGPELVLDGTFADLHGAVRIERAGKRLWSRDVATGEPLTQFSMQELESFLFRYDAFRVPGDVHILYLGASVCSYNEGIRLMPGDEVIVEWDGMGRPMRNIIS